MLKAHRIGALFKWSGRVFNKSDSDDTFRNPYKGTAIVSRTIYPPRYGQVRYRGSWWRAKTYKGIRIEANEFVKVIGIDGNVLIVTFFSSEENIDGFK